jgi:predicted DsbA family dithiol-disulfide isomerase
MEDKKTKTPVRHDIMQKPLPEILDEIDFSITTAEKAAIDARKAADDARLAGEQAAAQVMKKIRKLFLKMSQNITDELKDGEKKPGPSV